MSGGSQRSSKLPAQKIQLYLYYFQYVILRTNIAWMSALCIIILLFFLLSLLRLFVHSPSIADKNDI